MSKLSFFILFLSIIIAIIPFYYKFDDIKEIVLGNNKIDKNSEDKKKYILDIKNKTLEEEVRNNYINLKKELINYKKNNTYLKYERDTIEKINELEKDKKLFEDFENSISERSQINFNEYEIKNLTDLIDRYILSEN